MLHSKSDVRMFTKLNIKSSKPACIAKESQSLFHHMINYIAGKRNLFRCSTQPRISIKCRAGKVLKPGRGSVELENEDRNSSLKSLILRRFWPWRLIAAVPGGTDRRTLSTLKYILTFKLCHH